MTIYNHELRFSFNVDNSHQQPNFHGFCSKRLVLQVPEGLWVGEQRGFRNSLEIELPAGKCRRLGDHRMTTPSPWHTDIWRFPIHGGIPKSSIYRYFNSILIGWFPWNQASSGVPPWIGNPISCSPLGITPMGSCLWGTPLKLASQSHPTLSLQA